MEVCGLKLDIFPLKNGIGNESAGKINMNTLKKHGFYSKLVQGDNLLK